VKVLIPLDGSDLSNAIMPTARRLAELVPGTEFHLLTVLEPGSVSGRTSRTVTEGVPAAAGQSIVRAPLPRLIESHGEALERIHHEVVEELDSLAATALSPAAWVSDVAWAHDPADAIIEAADRIDADVIVMATHGRSGISHLLAGSVAEAVIRRSGRPVLVQNPLARAGR
jgi:nucleotide-binding universal stress UspA family protein